MKCEVSSGQPAPAQSMPKMPRSPRLHCLTTQREECLHRSLGAAYDSKHNASGCARLPLDASGTVGVLHGNRIDDATRNRNACCIAFLSFQRMVKPKCAIVGGKTEGRKGKRDEMDQANLAWVGRDRSWSSSTPSRSFLHAVIRSVPSLVGSSRINMQRNWSTS